MVQPPNIEQLIKEAERIEQKEASGNFLDRDFDLLSELS